LTPPFEPNLLEYNFDKKEIAKGDGAFKKELYCSLRSENEHQFERLFP